MARWLNSRAASYSNGGGSVVHSFARNSKKAANKQRRTLFQRLWKKVNPNSSGRSNSGSHSDSSNQDVVSNASVPSGSDNHNHNENPARQIDTGAANGVLQQDPSGDMLGEDDLQPVALDPPAEATVEASTEEGAKDAGELQQQEDELISRDLLQELLSSSPAQDATDNDDDSVDLLLSVDGGDNDKEDDELEEDKDKTNNSAYIVHDFTKESDEPVQELDDEDEPPWVGVSPNSNASPGISGDEARERNQNFGAEGAARNDAGEVVNTVTDRRGESGNADEREEEQDASLTDHETPESPPPAAIVTITGGTHAGKTGIYIKQRNCFVHFQDKATGQEYKARHQNVAIQRKEGRSGQMLSSSMDASSIDAISTLVADDQEEDREGQTSVPDTPGLTAAHIHPSLLQKGDRDDPNYGKAIAITGGRAHKGKRGIYLKKTKEYTFFGIGHQELRVKHCHATVLNHVGSPVSEISSPASSNFEMNHSKSVESNANFAGSNSEGGNSATSLFETAAEIENPDGANSDSSSSFTTAVETENIQVQPGTDVDVESNDPADLSAEIRENVQQHQDENENDHELQWEQGSIVLITGGTHKGKRGVLLHETAKKICFLFDGDRLYVNKSNVLVETCQNNVDLVKENEEGGTHVNSGVAARTAARASNTGRIQNVTHAANNQDNNQLRRATQRNASKTSTRKKKTNPNDTESVGTKDVNQWRCLEEGVSRNTSLRKITKMRYEQARKEEKNFLTHFFGDRALLVETPINEMEAQDTIHKKLSLVGSHIEEFVPGSSQGPCYELVSTKVQNDGDSKNHFSPGRVLQCYYVQLSGVRHGNEVTVKALFNELGDFASLKTSKVMARLELLQSPCSINNGIPAMVPNLERNQFELLAIEGNDGCGFICENFLEKLCSELKIKISVVDRVLCLQVRAVIPALGIFKGMLMTKRISSGRPPIQLTPSMCKVGKSLKPEPDDRAFLWVTSAGVSPSQMSQYVGRYLDESLKNPPKSFDDMLKKNSLTKKKGEKDGNMIIDVWRSLGVPRELCFEYAEQSAKKKCVEHCFVRGVADPTNSLPHGTVFVTGLHHSKREQNRIFVTRSPCLLPEDGRVLPHVNLKPNGMSEEDWEWLRNLPFGAIIFSDAKPGMEPLPVHIANGDLDGDLYFVCWNDKILRQITEIHIVDRPVEEEISGTTGLVRDEQWLEKAQSKMVDMHLVLEQHALMSAFWNLCKEESAKQDEGIHHRAARAFGEAHRQALDISKHGGKITLPADLHSQVPERLHQFLVVPADSSP